MNNDDEAARGHLDAGGRVRRRGWAPGAWIRKAGKRLVDEGGLPWDGEIEGGRWELMGRAARPADSRD